MQFLSGMILRVHLFLNIKPQRILAVRVASQKKTTAPFNWRFSHPQIFIHFLQVFDFVDSQFMVGVGYPLVSTLTKNDGKIHHVFNG